MPDASAQVGQGAPTRMGAGRKRNTMNNMMSKQGFNAKAMAVGGELPALDPASVANFYSQLQTLQSSLSAKLAGLRSQRKGLRGEASVMRADVKAQGREALVSGINEGIERGISGSSADLEQRIQTRASTASGLADVNRQLYDALAQSKIEGQTAKLETLQGRQALAAGVISERMTLEAQEQQNQIAIRLARMQAKAQSITDQAQLDMAQKQLRIARQSALGLQALANNPYNPYESIFDQSRPGGKKGSKRPTRVYPRAFSGGQI